MQNILIAHQHQILADSIIHAFADQFHFFQARTSKQMQTLLRKESIAIALISLEIEGDDDSLRMLKELVDAGHKVIVISAHGFNRLTRACIHFGAKAFLDHNASLHELGEAINSVLLGNHVFSSELVIQLMNNEDELLPHLTTREKQILDMLLEFPMPSNQAIADKLFVSSGRIKNVMTALFEKFNVATRYNLALEVRRRGYFPGLHESRLMKDKTKAGRKYIKSGKYSRHAT